MVRRTLRVIGVAALVATPVAAQFGVAGNRKKDAGTTFEEMQKQMAGDGDPMAGLNMDDLQNQFANVMNDPEMMKMMEGMGDNVAQAMEQLSQMDPQALMKQMEESLKMLTDESMVDTIMGQKDEILKNLKETGMASAEDIARFEADPEAFEAEMRGAFSKMKDVFADPETMNAALEMMKGMSDVLSDPESAMKELAKQMSGQLSDDDKIEEARLQLLTNPELAGNPALASIFDTDEMKDVLNDPVKWRDSVRKGQGMLADGDDDGAAAGMGEL
eukprot:scaffold40988_cov52-Attheya_sp.AAC.4